MFASAATGTKRMETDEKYERTICYSHLAELGVGFQPCSSRLFQLSAMICKHMDIKILLVRVKNLLGVLFFEKVGYLE